MPSIAHHLTALPSGGDGGLVAKLCPTLVTPWTIAHQDPLSMGFSRQEYWSGLPFPSPRPSGNHWFILCIYKSVSLLLYSFVLFFRLHISKNTVFVFLWLTSVSIIPSKSILVVANGKIPFFLVLVSCEIVLHVDTITG